MLLFCKQINTSSKSCYSARCSTKHLPYKLLSHKSVKKIACRTITIKAKKTVVLKKYRKHVAKRAAKKIAPKPLNANQIAALVKLLKNPPAGKKKFLLNLLTNRVPPGVNKAAYVKASFLAAIAKSKAKSPLLTPKKAIKLLSTMQSSYNIHPLINALNNAKLAPIAAKALSHTLLMFNNFYNVKKKAKASNKYAKQVMQS